MAELPRPLRILVKNMREVYPKVHSLCDVAGNVTIASLLENWIGQSGSGLGPLRMRRAGHACLLRDI